MVCVQVKLLAVAEGGAKGVMQALHEQSVGGFDVEVLDVAKDVTPAQNAAAAVVQAGVAGYMARRQVRCACMASYSSDDGIVRMGRWRR